MADDKVDANSVKVSELPVPVRLLLDVLMLRSTVPTAIIYAVIWACVTGFICYSIGLFAAIGLPGYEQRGEAAKVKQQVQWLVGTDIEYYYGLLCNMPNSVNREQVAEHFTRLQQEYQFISNGRAVTLAPCAPGGAQP